MIVAITLFFSLIPWLHYWQYPIHERFPFSAAIFASLLIYVSLQSAYVMVRAAQKRFTPLVWGTWITVALAYIAFLALQYPGFPSVDDAFLAGDLADGGPSGWHSFSYSLFVQASYFIFGQMFATGLFQVFMIIAIAWALLTFIPRKGSIQQMVGCGLILSLLLWPTTQGIVLVINRDSTFTLGLVLFALVFISKPLQKNDARFTYPEILALSGALVVLADLRQDAKPFLLALPIFAAAFRVFSWKQVGASVLALAIFSSVFFVVFPRFFNYQSYNYHYRLFSYINPLSAVLKLRGTNQLSDHELAILNKVIDTDKLVEYYSPFDVDPAHRGAIRPGFSSAEYNRFTRTAIAILFRNRDLVLRNRVNMAIKSFNLEGDDLFYDDGDSWNPALSKGRDFFNYHWGAPQNSLAKYHRTFLQGAIMTPNRFVRVLFNSIVPPLTLLFIFSILFPWNSRIGLMSVLLLSRLPVVFAFAPAAYFKYYESYWLGGWAFLFVTWFMWSEARGEIGLPMEKRVSQMTARFRKFAPPTPSAHIPERHNSDHGPRP